MTSSYMHWAVPHDPTDITIRVVAVVLFMIWQWYWIVTERRADREKPKKLHTRTMTIKRDATLVSGFFYYLQFMGLAVFPFTRQTSIQLVGLLLIVIGMAMSIAARRTIGTNWAHAAEYQIKTNHELVTGGIYAFIRHPIYAGLILSSIGAELVVSSYVVYVTALVLTILAYSQARQEERLLTTHFKSAYVNYMKRSHMFIPFVW